MAKKSKIQERQEELDEELDKAIVAMNGAQEILEPLQAEMREVADNLEEHFSETSRYEAVLEIAGRLEEALESVGSAIDLANGCDFSSYYPKDRR